MKVECPVPCRGPEPLGPVRLTSSPSPPARDGASPRISRRQASLKINSPEGKIHPERKADGLAQKGTDLIVTCFTRMFVF